MIVVCGLLLLLRQLWHHLDILFLLHIRHVQTPESSECPTPADASLAWTLRWRGRSVRADADNKRSAPRSVARCPIERSVRANGASARTKRRLERSVRSNEASARTERQPASACRSAVFAAVRHPLPMALVQQLCEVWGPERCTGAPETSGEA